MNPSTITGVRSRKRQRATFQGTVDPSDGAPVELILNALVDAIEDQAGRGKRQGGFGQYKNSAQLRSRLKEIFFGGDGEYNSNKERSRAALNGLDWLRKPFIRAILAGNPSAMNDIRICPPLAAEKESRLAEDSDDFSDSENDNKMTMIHWLCQWKLLRTSFGWRGADDMVLLAMRLGAKIENLGSEQPSTLSCAILYGSADTIRHLFQAMLKQGTNVNEYVYRDLVLRNLWKKVLDRSCPHILKLMAQYIPVTERAWTTLCVDLEADVAGGKPKQTQESHVTAVDYMLHKLLVWTRSIPVHLSNLPSDCWKVVGIPSVDDVGSCILYLLHKGIVPTPTSMPLLRRFVSTSFYGSTVPEHYAHSVAQMFFGNWLPTKTVQMVAYRKAQERTNRLYMQSKAKICAICLEDHHRDVSWRWWLSGKFHRLSSEDQKTTLYCGHTFCAKCIIEWGSSEPEVFSSTRTVEISCPICRKPLAREFLSKINKRSIGRIGDRRRNTLGIGHSRQPGPRGPQLLSKEQITTECNARGLSVHEIGFDNAQETLCEQWKRVRQQKRGGPDIMVDLAASETLSPKHVAAKHGAAFIPIQVNGIPILAGLSGSSPYTTVTPAAAKMLGLVTKQLTSNQFQVLRCGRVTVRDGRSYESSSNDNSDSDDDERLTVTRHFITMAIIEELTITLGDESTIEVHLRNAIVQVAEPTNDRATDNIWRPGIALGLDFLESAAWTQATVEVDIAQSIGECSENDSNGNLDDRRFMIILHGAKYIHLVTQNDLAQKLHEELRYYAFNGQTFRTPLLYIKSVGQDDRSPSSKMFYSVRHIADPSNSTNTTRRRRRNQYTE